MRSTILIFLPPLIDICTLFDELACVLLPAREEDDAGLVAVDGGLTAVGVGFVTAGFVADGGLAYGLPIRGILVVDLTLNAEPATGCLNLDFTAVVDEPAAPSGVPTSAADSFASSGSSAMAVNGNGSCRCANFVFAVADGGSTEALLPFGSTDVALAFPFAREMAEDGGSADALRLRSNVKAGSRGSTDALRSTLGGRIAEGGRVIDEGGREADAG